jgi:hypothetical protein
MTIRFPSRAPLPAAADAVVVAVVVVVAVAHLVPADLLRVALLPLRRAQFRPAALLRADLLRPAVAEVDVAADAVVVAQW